MKVLHTIYGLNRKLGGPSSCTANLVAALNDFGVDADILSVASQIGDEDIIHGENIHYVRNDEKTPLKISANFKHFLENNVSNYDLIHGNAIWLWHTHLASIYSKRFSKPIVISPHGMLYPEALRVSAWKKKLILRLFQNKDLQQSDLLHACSMQEMKHIRDFGLKKPIAVVPNMLALNEIPEVRQSQNDNRRFGFVGRINRIKNLDILLQAWNLLGPKTSECELLIIGADDLAYEKELKTFADTHNLRNVVFTGFKAGKELSGLVKSLDCLILPSKSENFGMVVPEALVYGVPVIASTGTPWEELPLNQCGFWIDPTVSSLAEAISEMISVSESERRIMGERGRQLVEQKYLSSAVAHQMKSVYEWVLSGDSKPDFVYE